MIEAQNLSKIYRMGSVEVAALREVSLTIDASEFVGIMGSSGSGKSTLLHQLGLLDTPTSGSIVISGTDVSGLDEDRKSVV